MTEIDTPVNKKAPHLPKGKQMRSMGEGKGDRSPPPWGRRVLARIESDYATIKNRCGKGLLYTLNFSG
jgi:hypothetical protein